MADAGKRGQKEDVQETIRSRVIRGLRGGRGLNRRPGGARCAARPRQLDHVRRVQVHHEHDQQHRRRPGVHVDGAVGPRGLRPQRWNRWIDHGIVRRGVTGRGVIRHGVPGNCGPWVYLGWSGLNPGLGRSRHSDRLWNDGLGGRFPRGLGEGLPILPVPDPLAVRRDLGWLQRRVCADHEDVSLGSGSRTYSNNSLRVVRGPFRADRLWNSGGWEVVLLGERQIARFSHLGVKSMAAVSRADAVWEGDLPTGKGRVKAASGTFDAFPVTWGARAWRHHGGTSPEELLAAAHAACYSMAFSNGLSKAGHKVERLNTTAEVEFVPGTGITTITLTTVGHIHGIDAAEFQKEAEAPKEGCPISTPLHGNVALKLNARLDLEH